ncbi:hypothetical protein [Dyella sp. SG609]|uniref:hypothetical protein n=1 Tax=Dyella sp. SG609 TaxID=2587018 RepID=UPI0014452D0B|nr:hypothetical protein [Dyella sp. SG609]NKJ20860.1 hypothetical protein [Dyella sp. SG609]
MDVRQFRKQFWTVPALTPITFGNCQVQKGGDCSLTHSATFDPFLPGDDIWISDTKGRVFRALVHSWSKSTAELRIGVEYRDEVIGKVGVALRFSPHASMQGAKRLIEEFGGVPSLIYEPLTAFSRTREGLCVQVANVEYDFVNVEPLWITGEPLDAASNPLLGIEFVVMGNRLGVEITSLGDFEAYLLCDVVRARILHP